MSHDHCHNPLDSAFDPQGGQEAPSSQPGEKLHSEEELIDRVVENAVVRAIFNDDDISRRRFMEMVGTATATAVISSIFPLGAAKALAKEGLPGGLEKKDVSVGFIPITCATPIIMSEPMGFYKKNGLNATVRRASGWAMIRDWAVNKEVDAAHMLTPMPLAISLGVGSAKTPFYMPAVENVNGQAITLANKHKGVQSAKDMKGFRFCVPFDYSMHNFLLRYFLAEGGLHPDKDVQIRVIPPPEMVANLRAGNVDGYLAPDPFNQRAVYENVGFIYMLSKDIWPGHPCCAFAISEDMAIHAPNTFHALFRSIIEATQFASNPANRKDIAQAIAPKNYLNQPAMVIEQVLTGKFPDGKGNILDVPDRIDFDPFPWHSMAVWILTQMKRWGYLKGDVNYKEVAEKVYLAAECDKVAKELGYATHDRTYKKHVLMGGRVFDPAQPDEYLKGFQIHNMT
jgi:nitrate/nitrite transport system substrate-binding protein